MPLASHRWQKLSILLIVGLLAYYLCHSTSRKKKENPSLVPVLPGGLFRICQPSNGHRGYQVEPRPRVLAPSLSPAIMSNASTGTRSCQLVLGRKYQGPYVSVCFCTTLQGRTTEFGSRGQNTGLRPQTPTECTHTLPLRGRKRCEIASSRCIGTGNDRGWGPATALLDRGRGVPHTLMPAIRRMRG